jgi:hypothetical protein
VQNGKPTAWWSEKAGAASTKIEVISPLPTIYYNCYYAGSLCKNLELTQTGAFAGTIDMELVYDKDTKRRNSRRRKICPGTWNKNHLCPEPDQPDVWVFDQTRDTPLDVLNTNPIKISSGLQPDVKPKYLIADYEDAVSLTSSPSGLMYTCDEFPFARLVESRRST